MGKTTRSSACRAGAGTGCVGCASWCLHWTPMPPGSISGRRWRARRHCGGSGWPCWSHRRMGDTKMWARPGRRGQASSGSHWRRGARCASAPPRTLGWAGCDHGHGRRPPARGSRAPGVELAPGPRRRAV